MNEQTTDNFAAAFMISLAAALIEIVRSAVPVHSAAGNRLALAAEATEKAIEYIPRDEDPFHPLFMASEFLPMISARIQSAVVHGGWRRGEVDCDRFLQNMLERLNDPKNVAKGDYLAMTWPDVRDKMREEAAEVECEMWQLAIGQGTPAAAVREFADLAVVAMIGAAKIENHP